MSDYIDQKNDAGTVLGQKTSSLIGFFGITPVNQPDALTSELTTITYTTATTFAVTINPVSATGAFGFADIDEAMTFMTVLENIQVRIGEMEDRLQESGIIAGGTTISVTTSLALDYVSKGGDSDGTIFGQASTDLIGFWGITPCNQPATSTTPLGTIVTTSTVSTTTYVYTMAVAVSGSAGYGFGTTNQAQSFFALMLNLHTRIREVETNLVEVGLIAGGTGISTTTSAAINYLDKGSDTGTILGKDSSEKIGFWGTTPANQPAALTTALTTIMATVSTTMTADYAFGSLANTVAVACFANATEGATFFACLANAQTRMTEIETRIEELGLQASS